MRNIYRKPQGTSFFHYHGGARFPGNTTEECLSLRSAGLLTVTSQSTAVPMRLPRTHRSLAPMPACTILGFQGSVIPVAQVHRNCGPGPPGASQSCHQLYRLPGEMLPAAHSHWQVTSQGPLRPCTPLCHRGQGEAPAWCEALSQGGLDVFWPLTPCGTLGEPPDSLSLDFLTV